MNFVRKIIEPDKLSGIIEIPDKLKKSQVEVIILPVDRPTTNILKHDKTKRCKSFKKLYEKPIKVDKIHIFSKEELHER
jgi:hypothetical protein